MAFDNEVKFDLAQVKNKEEIINKILEEFLEEHREFILKLFNNNWHTIKMFSYFGWVEHNFYLFQHWNNEIIRVLNFNFSFNSVNGITGRTKKHIHICEERFDKDNVFWLVKSRLNKIVILSITKFLKKSNSINREKIYKKYFKDKSLRIYYPSFDISKNGIEYQFVYTANVYLHRNIMMVYPLSSSTFSYKLDNSFIDNVIFWVDDLHDSEGKNRNDMLYLFEPYFKKYRLSIFKKNNN